jgi:hypothetical protein
LIFKWLEALTESLTPKRRTGPTGAKCVLGSVAWSHTIFEFWIFFPSVSLNKLCVSTNFMILGATDQKLCMFEVFRRSLGRAGMYWSQWGGVDHMRKKMVVGGRKRGGSFIVEGAHAAANGPWQIVELLIFCYFLFFILTCFFGKFGEWAKAFGRMDVQLPHYLKLAPTLGSVKCSIPHGNWRFHFFPNFIFSKFRVHLDLYIYRWNFCFMKNWDH